MAEEKNTDIELDEDFEVLDLVEEEVAKTPQKTWSKRIKNAIIPGILLGIILFSAYKLISIRMEYKRADEEYDALAEYVVIETQPVAEVSDSNEEVSEEEIPEIQREYPVLDIDFDSLISLNSDFQGWLYIPAVEISYPVVYGRDNEHYLHYTYNGKYNGSGCIFSDCENSPDFTDRNTFVYGHNMKNGSMFGTLKRLRREKDLCASNPYFYIYMPEEVLKYEIFSYYTLDSSSDQYLLVTSDSQYDAYINTAIRKSEYAGAGEVDFSERPAIVSLSTCSGNAGGTTRFMVHGALVGRYSYVDDNSSY